MNCDQKRPTSLETNHRVLVIAAMACFAALILFTGCATRTDAVAQDGKAEKNRPAITEQEARAIAKEAYIYGFPIVDGYRIMYAYFVDIRNRNTRRRSIP